MKVLSWITYANTELTGSKLLRATVTKAEMSSTGNGDMLDLYDTLSTCLGLVVIGEYSDVIRTVYGTV